MPQAPVQCKYCGSPTQLFIREVPVCVACSNDLEAGRDPGRRDAPLDHVEILRTLKSELASARWQVEEATREFNAVMRDVPSGIPHADGLQRRLNVSKRLTDARESLANAHDRVNEFLVRGTIPEHLRKRPGSEGGTNERGKASGAG
jgi:hypothetical protein